MTPLAAASLTGSTEIVTTLLQNKADPNLVQSVVNCSPMMHAARKRHWAVVHLLLAAKADPNIIDAVRRTSNASTAIEIEASSDGVWIANE